MLLEEIGKLDEKLSSVLRCLLPPWAVECLACSSNGNINILLSGFED